VTARTGDSEWLSDRERAWVRSNLLRLRLARGSLTAAALRLPAPGDYFDELMLARLALEVGVSARELATDPDKLVVMLSEPLQRAARLIERADTAAEGQRLAELVWTEAKRLAFPVHGGHAADLLGHHAMLQQRPLEAVTWLLKALATPWGVDPHRRSDLIARMGAALLLTERYDIATAVLSSADPDPGTPPEAAGPQALCNWAASLLLQGRYQAAADTYQRVVAASGNLPPRLEAQAWIGYGAALGLVGDVQGSLAASTALDDLLARHPLPDIIPALRSNETWLAAVSAPWRDARQLLLAELYRATDPFDRANMCDTLVYILARGEQWGGVWETCSVGLAAIQAGGGKSHLLKARLLWARAVAARHLGRDGALRDRAWAEDLFDLLGARAHLATLPTWPEDEHSTALLHNVADGADHPLNLRQGVVGRQAQANGAGPPLGFEPEIPVVRVERTGGDEDALIPEPAAQDGRRHAVDSKRHRGRSRSSVRRPPKAP